MHLPVGRKGLCRKPPPLLSAHLGQIEAPGQVDMLGPVGGLHELYLGNFVEKVIGFKFEVGGAEGIRHDELLHFSGHHAPGVFDQPRIGFFHQRCTPLDLPAQNAGHGLHAEPAVSIS